MLLYCPAACAATYESAACCNIGRVHSIVASLNRAMLANSERLKYGRTMVARG
jgi:hypothetical protein